MADQLRFSSNFWPKNTTIRMINVPWDSAYKDIVQFDDALARDAWLDSQFHSTMSTTHMTYVAPGETIVLPCPVTSAELYNYLYVDNPSYSITDDIDTFDSLPRRYCYFITSASWVSPATCQVTLQLDAWTTWAPHVRFTRAFVSQGHAAIANRNLWNGNSLAEITPAKMRRYLNTPEAVDPGGDFISIQSTWTDMTKTATGGESGVFIGLMSSVDLTLPWGDANNPNIGTASGSIQQGMLAGVQVVYMKVADFLALLEELKNAPWVSRNIMQIWLAPACIAQMFSAGYIRTHPIYRPAQSSPIESTIQTLNPMRTFNTHFLRTNYLVAPKLLTAPYSFIELNSFEGSPLVLKPQFTQSLTAMPLVAKGVVMAPWNRIAIYPLYYNAISPYDSTYTYYDIQGNEVSKALSDGDNLDSAIWIDGFPTFSFTSDGYLQWLASGAHSRAWSYQNNDWNYHKGTLQRELAYNQDMENRDIAYNQYQQTQNLQQDQAWIRTGMSALGGINTVDPFGSIARAGQAVVNQVMDDSARSLDRAQAHERWRVAGRQADENNALAAYAMRGDYQQTIGSLMATQRDAQITPPSVIGTAGGNGWNYAMGLLGYRVSYKTIGPSQEAILIDYFTRYGYAINELMDMPSDLRLMTKFTYWKLEESFLWGNITEGAKNAIRGIFERGVTVWNNPSDIVTLSWDESDSNGINSNNQFSY